MGKRFPFGTPECHIRGGHFLTLKAAAVTLWNTQRLPFEMIYQVLMAIEPCPCYRRLFVQAPQWKYIYDQSSLLAAQEQTTTPTRNTVTYTVEV